MTDKNILIEEAFLAGYEECRKTDYHGYYASDPSEVLAEAKRLAKEFAEGRLKHPLFDDVDEEANNND